MVAPLDSTGRAPELTGSGPVCCADAIVCVPCVTSMLPLGLSTACAQHGMRSLLSAPH